MKEKFPFIIKQNSLNQDILITNSKQINLHKSDSSLHYQQVVFENSLEDLIYEAYEINPQLYAIKSYDPADSMYSIDIIGDNKVNIYSGVNYSSLNISYNKKYMAVWDMDYECPIVNLVAAYDIEQRKLIDCSDIKTSNSLIDGVIKSRRCMFDVIASILTNQELMIDRTRLYSFMSFVSNNSINQDNFSYYANKMKPYILRTYPELKDISIPLNQKELMNLNHQYGLDYFVFKKQAYTINDIKYLSNKTYIKK